jgi:carboxyl-terminal processing protease
MRLTTARYYTPSGRSIQAKGIDPDIIVEQAKIEKIASAGEIHEADLVGALDRDKNAPAPEVKKVITDPPPADSKGDEAKKVEKKESEDAQDYQLSRAIDLIRGVSMYEGRLNTN